MKLNLQTVEGHEFAVGAMHRAPNHPFEGGVVVASRFAAEAAWGLVTEVFNATPHRPFVLFYGAGWTQIAVLRRADDAPEAFAALGRALRAQIPSWLHAEPVGAWAGVTMQRVAATTAHEMATAMAALKAGADPTDLDLPLCGGALLFHEGPGLQYAVICDLLEERVRLYPGLSVPGLSGWWVPEGAPPPGLDVE